MKVSQINLHHSKAASAALVLRLATGTEDLICIQEPWLYKDWVRGLNKDGYSILYAAGPGKTRACIMVKSNLKAFILSDFSDKDTCTIALENKRRVVWFMSCYMAHDHGDDPPNSMTRKAMSNANRKNIPLVICADVNAHHTIWGSSDINQRGESLLNFIVDNKLTIVNRGNEPTFIVTNRREVLDVTLISDKFSYLISDWSVSKDCSFSDHLYIDFNFSIEVDKVEHYLNRRKTNWTTHSKVLSDMLPSCPTSIDDKSSLDSAVVSLTKALADATEKSCMKTIRKGKAKPAWWNAEIAEKRKECRKLFNEAKVYGNWSTYKSSCNKFKNLVRKAKRQSWRKYCSGIENSSETSRLRKILSLNPTIPTYIQKTDGSWTTSSKDILEVLMETHFPGCKELDTLPRENLNTDVQDISGIPITQDRIRWAVKSFSPFKSPGPDGIIPADLQNNIDLLLPWLMKIFKACLQLSHVPSIWTTYKIVFIPKGGKTSHTKAKDFRPISLSSFLLKTLERIIDTFIRSSLNAEDLSNTQHAYMKGKSTETALHTLVGHIERSLHYKEYTLVAFLDIEGAFNNVKPESVLDAMRQLRIDAAVTSFVEKLLNFRRIESNLGVSNIQKIATRGTPQGGVLSPLLWNININTLLKAMEMTCCKTVAYADDVAVVATGKDLNILSEILESALNLLAKWCQGCGLGVNPTKTELVLFTRRYKIPKFNTPRINGVSLSLSNEAKYLGLILDSKLNWNLNTNNRTTKAVNALYCCKKAIGLNWGLNPRNAYWLCNCVIRPILFYGATVWWPALEKSYQQAKFERIMRMMSIMTTGALRTTPSKALFTILNWLPPDIAAKKIAAQTALRLCATRAWKYQGYGHANILGNIYREYKVDYSIPTPLFDSGFMVHIPEGSYYDNGLHTSEEEIQIFTDGSKSKDRVGIGIFSEQLDLKLSHTLPNYCSVIQAEIMAIKTAVQWIQYMDISNKDIRIFTDSKAALSSLSGVYTTSKIVRECRMSLEEIASHSNVTLTWVPGHRDIYGNCVADSLARAGAGQNHHGHICDIGAPLSVCKQLISREFHLKGMERWTTESTCVETRKIWPLMEERRTAQLLNLSRSHLRNLIGVITGHWPFGIHAKRLGIHHYDYCRSCKDEEEEETTEHLLCHCPIFEYQRHQLFGLQRITDKSCLSRVDPSRLNSFIVTTRWFAGPNGQEV